MKLLLYKQQPELIKKVDFDNDDTFLEPTLSAYFAEKEFYGFPNEMLEEYLQGYFLEREELKTDHISNHFEVAYLPEIGYVKKGEKSVFLPIIKVEGTPIEVMKYPIPLFKRIMEVPDESKKHYDDLHDRYLHTLTNAIHHIKNSSPIQYALIEKCCKRIVMFKTDPANTNSFASRKANGTAFFNVYQEDYDEVFFIDDIAHQTGHIILTTLFYDPKTVYKINANMDVEHIIGMPDHRIINVLVHALYTYYTTFQCLDNCIKNNCFTEIQKREAEGRIGFYIWKFRNDLKRWKMIEEHFEGLENIFTEIGLGVFNAIMDEYHRMEEKWGEKMETFNYKDQTYNFNRSKFFEMNKASEVLTE